MSKIKISLYLLCLALVFTTSGYSQKHDSKNMGNSQNSSANETMMQIDRYFIEMMIPHHQDAIDMAKLALEKTKKAEIKKLSKDIISAQTDEIAVMKKWYKEWFGTDLQGGSMMRNQKGKGMVGQSMMMMDLSMSHVMMGGTIDDLKKAPDFDKKFIEMMVSHHKMAVTMSGMLLDSKKTEMRKLGRDIITAQAAEIEMMIKWYQNWYGSW